MRNGKPKQPVINQAERDRMVLNQMVFNMMMTRGKLLNQLFEEKHDINKECGYPDVINLEDYQRMYDREGVGTRVTNIHASECWSLDPEVTENQDEKETAFEKAWADLVDRMGVLSYLLRVDQMCGIGYYGLLLVGVDDRRALDQPIEGLRRDGTVDKTKVKQHKLLYLRPFSQSHVTVKKWENDETNPRFGMPVMYSIKFTQMHETSKQEVGPIDEGTINLADHDVHWSRVIHVADNLASSEVYGIPRQRPVYNRLLDIRKIAGGSGEMFWLGAFPGLSIETDPKLVDDSILDVEATRAEIEKYQEGFQRYLALQGVHAETLAPNIADPTMHIETQLKLVAITIEVPLRIFLGSEQAQLASGQDARTWNRRLGNRQLRFVNPRILRPFVDRLQMMGILPGVPYAIKWPDLNSPTDADKADTAVKRTEALATYVSGNCHLLVPPLEYLTIFQGLSLEQAMAVMKVAKANIKKLDKVGDLGAANRPATAPKGTSTARPGPSKRRTQRT